LTDEELQNCKRNNRNARAPDRFHKISFQMKPVDVS